MQTDKAVKNIAVNASNVAQQTYYNLTRLCMLTGFANPISAIKALNLELTVSIDAGGNICRLICNRVNS